jgi:hypothetical protein
VDEGRWSDMGYANTRAGSANVPFAYDDALAAARDLHALADTIRAAQVERDAAAATATQRWSGPKRLELDEKMTTERADAARIAGGVEETAGQIARAWAQARGEQDRINHARWQDHDEQNRHDGELNVVEYAHKLGDNLASVFGHGTDYGPPPSDPPVPTPPRYEPTRAPQHAEFERVG